MNDQIALDIACAARILAAEGLSMTVAGHLSLDVGGEMYVNRYGPSFSQVRPQDIIRVDYDGKVIEGEGYTNDTIRLHGILHRMVPKARAMIHTHPPSVVTFSSFRIVPEIYDQESCFLAGDIAIYDEDYEGLATTADRISPMATVLQHARNLIMPNHGAMTSGDDIPVAAVRMILLEHVVKRYMAVQQAALTLEKKPKGIPLDVAIRTRTEAGLKAVEQFVELVWQDYIKRLGLSGPGAFN